MVRSPVPFGAAAHRAAALTSSVPARPGALTTSSQGKRITLHGSLILFADNFAFFGLPIAFLFNILRSLFWT